MKVAMLTSGGDCQGLNSALRGVGKSLYKIFGKDVDIYGIRDGYRGLIYGDIRKMDPAIFPASSPWAAPFGHLPPAV